VRVDAGAPQTGVDLDRYGDASLGGSPHPVAGVNADDRWHTASQVPEAARWSCDWVRDKEILTELGQQVREHLALADRRDSCRPSRRLTMLATRSVMT
jgi:hypothetical protein